MSINAAKTLWNLGHRQHSSTTRYKYVVISTWLLRPAGKDRQRQWEWSVVLICSDFNCTSAAPNAMDEDQQPLFNVTGMTHKSHKRHSPMPTSTWLDLIICCFGSGQVSSVKVGSSHISDLDLVTWLINLPCTKSAHSTVTNKFHNPKKRFCIVLNRYETSAVPCTSRITRAVLISSLLLLQIQMRHIHCAAAIVTSDALKSIISGCEKKSFQ